MKIFGGLRRSKQNDTEGEVATPDGGASVWVISMLFHLCLLLVMGFTVVGSDADQKAALMILAPSVDEDPEDLIEINEEFEYSDDPSDQIGTNSVGDMIAALSEAPIIAEIPEVPLPTELEENDIGDVEVNDVEILIATGERFNENLPIKGSVGENAVGAEGAVDRITHEIVLSLEERKTLVVWLFDQSGSLTRQRLAIRERFARIYEELGVIQSSGNPAFSQHEDKPLLTSVIGFGSKLNLVTKKPTDNLAEIQRAVASLKMDETGIERVFEAVYSAVNEYKHFRVPNPRTRQPKRNVMIVVFTDEAGNDYNRLDETVRECRRYEIPVYVVGVPAPFGRRETLVKWVDPDPKFDQQPGWGRVDQGPESLRVERVKLHFSGAREDKDPIDSGFGPFALTRLCYETGGIYFAVHPNRNFQRAVSRGETTPFSAHIEHFFDRRVMRRYRPDYVSATEYMRRVNQSKSRQALLRAAEKTWLTPMEEPSLRFVKRNEAALATSLSQAQRTAAKLEPRIRELYQVLKLGESDREKELVLRWQAGYDLAMGRVMAIMVRTEIYNSMLAATKRGMKFKNPKNNTWVLVPADEVTVGSKVANMANKAKQYLQRVVDDHPGTPWALLAERELKQPLSWKWNEQYTNLNPPARRTGGGGGTPRAARNDKKNMLKKPKPKRPIPKL